MKLTNRCEYAMLALLYIARCKPGMLIHGEEIAKAQDIPMRFLQQILYTLKQAKFIKSGKGRSGGYTLVKSPDQITLAEVVRLFEGPLASTRSVSMYFYESTPIEKESGMIAVLKEIREFVAKKLENTTLADVL